MTRRLQSLFLCLTCFVYALYRGRATKSVTHPTRICVIQLSKLGDMVCTTPVFSAIKKTYPAATVCVVGDAVNKALLVGHPDIDEYLIWNKKIFPLVKELRRRKFNFLCITSPSVEALAASYLAGVPCIATPVIQGGFSPYETRAYKLLRTLVLAIPHQMGAYAPREYLRLLVPLNIVSEDTKKTLVFSDTARRKVDLFLQNLPPYSLLVGIAPSAGNKIKEWPAERFAAIADYLVKRHNATVLVFGSIKDTDEVQKMMEGVTLHSNIHSTLNLFSLEELKAAIQRLDLFTSADTGPLYIAEAFNVATVDIIGPIDEREQPPIGPRHKVVVAPRQRPQLSVMNARIYDVREARRQVDTITIPMVEAAIEELL